MSKTEILEELPNLTSEERDEIRLKQALLEARLADMAQHPEKSISLEEFKARLSR